MSSRKVKVIIGILAVVVLVMLAAAHSRKSNYSIVIPKVLTYPTTTLTFSASKDGNFPRVRAPDASEPFHASPQLTQTGIPRMSPEQAGI